MLLTGITTSAPVPHTPAPGGTDWWYIGIGIGFMVVVVVVIIAAVILTEAAKIGAQAREGIDLMDEARIATLPVWEVQKTNVFLTRIWRSAEAARGALEQVLSTSRMGAR